jgi:hypothetical protein
MNIDFDIERAVTQALEAIDLDDIVEELVTQALRKEIQSLIYSAVKDRKESLNAIVKLSLDMQEALLKERST